MFERTLKAALSLAAVMLSLCPLGPVCAASPVWRFSLPQPHGNNILEMGLQNGLVWQVGERGQLYTSSDLDTWLPHDTATTRSLRSIAFFDGKAFISTEAGGILTANSVDAYSLKDLNTSDWLEGIAASNNYLVAVGDNGAIYSSRDGQTWARRGGFTAALRSVGFGGEQFVAVGEDGFVAISRDGQDWDTRISGTTAHLNKVSFINDRFWVVGDDGTVLTNNSRNTFFPVNVNVTNTLFAIAGNPNEVVIAGDSVVLLGDLQTGTWTQQADADSANLAPLWPYYSALWDGRLFLLGGRTGLTVEGFRTNAAAPMAWYTNPPATRNWLWSAARGPDFYAACGAGGTIVTSLDGIDWTREVVPPAAANKILLGIGGNTNVLVAVGNTGTILRSPNILTNTISGAIGEILTNLTSLFGVIWEQVLAPGTQGTNDLQAVAASSDKLLIGGARGTLFMSDNGRTWERPANVPNGLTNFFSGATFSPKGWIVTGTGGIILRNTDAETWTKQDSGVSQWIYAVRYVGEKLVAVGENGLILASDDGRSWTQKTSGTTEWLNDVTFAAGSWYIASGVGMVLTSPNLNDWTLIPTSTSKSLYGAVTDGQQLIMPGMEGVILRAQLAPSTDPVNFLSFGTASGDNIFLFEGVTDQRFMLEEKGGLDDGWGTVANLEILDSAGTLLYERPTDASVQSKFFRTRLLTP